MAIQREAGRLFEDVLGCKWTLAVLASLREGVARPGQIRRALPGLTSKVMQQRLQKLERFGLVVRRLIAERPLHVEYRLTPKGRQLCRLVSRVEAFAGEWEVKDASNA
ncbi:MAG: helix-turn-helix transcriptional regulator [Candidatus Eisenbacteria bacterium]|uniref:Helix-turn-helix transcriptional regulator n=1 Tax=Eiseniibacteriota bacterium TaxID=2212470 RepID=A0A849SMZ7_UNCEI|nr:helix-turn-helix transcriptional regulator [Candidatus Eisenbacteria bacterium]